LLAWNKRQGMCVGLTVSNSYYVLETRLQSRLGGRIGLEPVRNEGVAGMVRNPVPK